MPYITQLWSSLTDPVKAALVAGSLGIIGIIFTQVVTTAVQLWINSQRSTLERKALEVRLKHERESFKLQIAHEKNDKRDATKREKIEELYRKSVLLSYLVPEAFSLETKLRLQGGVDNDDSCNTFIGSVNSITTDMDIIVRLYVPEVDNEFYTVMRRTIYLTTLIYRLMTKMAMGDTQNIIGAEHAGLEFQRDLSTLQAKMREMMPR